MTDTERNKQRALEYIDVVWSFDPARYEPFLTDDPTYQGGVNVRQGLAGFAEMARFGRLLYPHGHDRHTIHAAVAEGEHVAIHLTVEATTNADKQYVNDYVLMFTFEDGRIAKLVEMLDFRVSTDKFDLSVLG